MFKKSKVKIAISTFAVPLIALTVITFAFKFFHDSKYEKAQYDANCQHNYGDAVNLARCYLPYQFEGNTLNFALELEIASIVVIPLVALLGNFI